MITPEQAVAACTRAAEAHAATNSWPRAVHLTIRSLIDRLADAHGHKSPLNDPRLPVAETHLDALGPLDDWHILDLGEIHQLLLEVTPTGQSEPSHSQRIPETRRALQGAWYTPEPVAEAMCLLTLGPQLDRLALDPDPGAMFDLLAIDPACGAGVFLLAASRLIAERIAARVTGTTPPSAPHIRAALPTVLRECVFGVDIDPVAVDIAKTALWLAVDASEPFTFIDRNVIVGNALNDDMPPAFTQRRGEPSTAAQRHNAHRSSSP